MEADSSETGNPVPDVTLKAERATEAAGEETKQEIDDEPSTEEEREPTPVPTFSGETGSSEDKTNSPSKGESSYPAKPTGKEGEEHEGGGAAAGAAEGGANDGGGEEERETATLNQMMGLANGHGLPTEAMAMLPGWAAAPALAASMVGTVNNEALLKAAAASGGGRGVHPGVMPATGGAVGDMPLGCNCKKSRCLKLYCQCFAAQATCTPGGCNCQQCQNVPEHEDARQEAIRTITERNPNAFQNKFRPEGAEAVHKMGCKCRKSACLKKYCECFNAGARCSEKCTCVGCQNHAGVGRPYEEAVTAARRGGKVLEEDGEEGAAAAAGGGGQAVPGTETIPTTKKSSKKRKNAPAASSGSGATSPGVGLVAPPSGGGGGTPQAADFAGMLPAALQISMGAMGFPMMPTDMRHASMYDPATAAAAAHSFDFMQHQAAAQQHLLTQQQAQFLQQQHQYYQQLAQQQQQYQQQQQRYQEAVEKGQKEGGGGGGGAGGGQKTGHEDAEMLSAAEDLVSFKGGGPAKRPNSAQDGQVGGKEGGAAGGGGGAGSGQAAQRAGQSTPPAMQLPAFYNPHFAQAAAAHHMNPYVNPYYADPSKYPYDPSKFFNDPNLAAMFAGAIPGMGSLAMLQASNEGDAARLNRSTRGDGEDEQDHEGASFFGSVRDTDDWGGGGSGSTGEGDSEGKGVNV